MSQINSIESASALFIDGGSEPSGMYMRESSHLDYNDITECKDYDKKLVHVYLITFLGYIVNILKN